MTILAWSYILGAIILVATQSMLWAKLHPCSVLWALSREIMALTTQEGKLCTTID